MPYRKRWHLGSRLLTVILALLILNTAVFVASLNWLLGSTNAVKDSLTVQSVATSVLTELLNAETGQRGYILTGNSQYLAPYHQSSVWMATRLDNLSNLTVDDPDISALIARLRELVAQKLEDLGRSVAIFDPAAPEQAIAMVNSGTGKVIMDEARQVITQIEIVERRIQSQREIIHNVAEVATYVSGAAFVLSSLFMVFFLYLYMRHQLSENQKVAAQLKQQANELDSNIRVLGTERNEIALINETSNFLQSCNTLDEVGRLTGPFMEKLFPGYGGTLANYAASRNQLLVVSRWGGFEGADMLSPDECWSLRRGQWHHHDVGDSAPTCAHLSDASTTETFCLPLVAHGETLGLLTLVRRQDATGPSFNRRTAEMAGRQLGLTLANILLRETLKEQSIRDPLTNAFNRRYFEVVAQKELAKAERFGRTMAVVMLDVDHFKRFNDLHGHAAGDTALVAVSEYLQAHIRGSDWLFRIGGEEFVLLLLETDAQDALDKAESLRAGVSALEMQHGGEVLPHVTISMGLAFYPGDGPSLEEVLEQADAALYSSKSAGRNRVTVATGMATSNAA